MNAFSPIIAAEPLVERPDYIRGLKRRSRLGTSALVLFIGIGGAWSMTATLHGAVTAAGRFVVASDVKKIQHPNGGVVASLPVQEGQHVEAGDIVLRLEDTLPRANYQIVARQLDESAVKSVRLIAERDGAPDYALPPELAARSNDPLLSGIVASEQRLFEVRRSARDGQRSQLRKRIAQLSDEIGGLRAQQAAKQREAGIIAKELVGVEELYRRNLVQLSRLSALQRDQASIEGQIGQFQAGVAQAQGKIAETELQIIQIDEDQRAEASKQLSEIQAKAGELTERMASAKLQLRQVDLRSPVTGTIHQLAVHTVGGVLQPGEAAMLIVPGEDAIQLDTQIQPGDIDLVSVGQRARVKVLAGNAATNPDIHGSVLRIGADATRDERRNQSFYTLRIELPREQVERLPVKLIAGMQAEVFIETGPRRPLDFLLKPFRTHLDRVFRER